ncbi:MAG: hypothetical protein ACYSTZ_13435 [Planctomycetota bacterium]|jgi:hypothetical protein
MEKTDQELEDGNLPRAELQEGLSEFRRKAPLTRPEDV